MAKRKKPPLSTVVSFMSEETQSRIETEPQEPTTLPVIAILPDFGQPRRLLPPDLAQAVAAGNLGQVPAVREWLARAEAGSADAALRRNVQELQRLADSIAHHGLISPISVRQPRPVETLPPGIDYVIVTGERRYWAHVLLLSQERQIQEGETLADPDQIKVTVSSPGVTIRAHQLIENLMREDINAIERARGLWALRYELSGLDPQAVPADDQNQMGVNHGSPPSELVPWARVEEVLGISKRYRIFMTSVLNLAPDAQAIVDQHDLAERTIRPIVQKLKDRPDLQVKALNQLLEWQAEAESEEGSSRAIVASIKQLVDQLLTDQTPRETAQARPTRSVSSAPVIRFRNRIQGTLDFLNRLKAEDREGLTEALGQQEFADLMIDLRNLRQQLDQLLEAARRIHPADETMTAPTEESAEND